MSSLIRKRWGAGAAVLHELLVVVGGRGKRVGHTAEVRIEPIKNRTSSKYAVQHMYTVKNVSNNPVPFTNQTLPGRDNLIIPGQGEFG
jgi:hypothetical protein